MAVPKGGVPRTSGQVDQVKGDAAAAFIAGAPGKEVYPWERPGVRDDLGKQSNITLPERLLLQVEWLAEKRGQTKKATIEQGLREFVARELKRLGIES